MSITELETVPVDIKNTEDGFVHICLEKDDGSWDEITLCGSNEIVHNPSCPGYHEEWEPGEEACPHCGIPICPDCVVISELDSELEF